MTDSKQPGLFLPDIAPSPKGGLTLYQGSQRVHIPGCEVEAFLDECSEVRKRQLIRSCLQIAKGMLSHD